MFILGWRGKSNMAFFVTIICFRILVKTNCCAHAHALNRSNDEISTKTNFEDSKKMLTHLRTMIDEKINDPEDTENVDMLLRNYLKNRVEELSRDGKNRIGKKNRRSLVDGKDDVPFSTKRFEKMLEKAIIKIITGDLSVADVMLLKGLNYSLDEVLSIRERELGVKMEDSEIPEVLRGVRRHDDAKENVDVDQPSSTSSTIDDHSKSENIPDAKNVVPPSSTISSTMATKKSRITKKKIIKDFDFDAYNKQAVYDYENVATKISQQTALDTFYGNEDYDQRFSDSKTNENDRDDENVDRVDEPHVVFKIRWDDSEFDSTSDERGKLLLNENFPTLTKKIVDDRESTIVDRGDDEDRSSTMKNRDGDDRRSTMKMHSHVSSKSTSWVDGKSTNFEKNTTPKNHDNKAFHSSDNNNLDYSLPVVYSLGNFVNEKNRRHEKITEKENVDGKIVNEKIVDESSKLMDAETTKLTSESDVESENVGIGLLSKKNSTVDDVDGKSEIYEGLEWVEDDVYRVIPQALDALNYDTSDNNYADVDGVDVNNGNRTSDLESGMFYDDGRVGTTDNDENTQNDEQTTLLRNNPSTRMPMTGTNLTTYQQLALAHRRDRNLSSPIDSQGQKAIEDIKLKVLAMTGRFNLSSSSNQVQRERLTMFSPVCQPPRNTDLETWSDPFSMNMYFQLNLTSGDHVVAAKMRIYKLPQSNVTDLDNVATVDEADDEEKKIRISIYFYTKSLKKHRSKKRLMDSVVTALGSQGSHLALDVRQALRFWRQNSRTSSHGNHSNNNNHGLVVQVEDQEGKPLKPSQFIQQASCHTSEQNDDDKAYQRVPALFIQACSRYVRVINGETVTYVNCGKSLRHAKH